MSSQASAPVRVTSPRPRRRRSAAEREAFSTALFTGLNIAVFAILAFSVIGAAVLYSQGA